MKGAEGEMGGIDGREGRRASFVGSERCLSERAVESGCTEFLAASENQMENRMDEWMSHGWMDELMDAPRRMCYGQH